MVCTSTVMEEKGNVKINISLIIHSDIFTFLQDRMSVIQKPTRSVW